MIKKLLTTIIIALGLIFITNVNSGEYGPVAEKETLWTIASRNRPSYDVTTQQMMLAIRRANPHAFQARNINTLKVGAILQLPTLAEVSQMSSTRALRAAKEQNKYWNNKQKKTSSTLKASSRTKKKKSSHSSKKKASSYKRHYKASQRELRKIQKQLKREQRKTRKLKHELAQIKLSQDTGNTTPTTGGAGNTVALQEELKLLEKTIQEKNVHIKQLENMKSVASETIKKLAATNKAQFNKLKAIAPDQVIDQDAAIGSLTLEGLDDPILSKNGSGEQKQTSSSITPVSSAPQNKNNAFLIVLSVLSLLFALALLWRLYAQKAAARSATKKDKQHIEEKEDIGSLNRYDPLLEIEGQNG